MAKLKLALVHNSRTCTVRRQVDAENMDTQIEGVLDALCEVATEHSIPGHKIVVSVNALEGEDAEQKEPVPQAGGAGSGDGEDND